MIPTEREGAYTFPDGSKYLGQYNSNGRKDGIGRLCFPDQSRYFFQYIVLEKSNKKNRKIFGRMYISNLIEKTQ